MSYRTAPEFDERFGRDAQDGEQPLAGGRYSIESYLEHQGDLLPRRFDANSYIALSEAMNHHDIGRGRGGVAAALSGVEIPVSVVGINSDRLYPLELQYEIARCLPRAPEVRIVESLVGHDGFLVETDAIGVWISEVLA